MNAGVNSRSSPVVLLLVGRLIVLPAYRERGEHYAPFRGWRMGVI
jgi:hypothetical protein